MKVSKTLLAKLLMSSTLLMGASVPMVTQAVTVSPIIKQIALNTTNENFVTVRSSKTDEVEYIKMDLFKILNPGEPGQERLEPELEKANPQIVFSPTRLILQPGRARKVRLVPMSAVEHEEVFRLRVISATPPVDPSEPKDPKSASSALTMNIGYDVLVRLMPVGKHVQQLNVDCNAGHYKLQATGNVRSEVRNLVADGVQLGNFNIYPTRERALTQSKTLSFEMDGKTFNYQGCVLEQ